MTLPSLDQLDPPWVRRRSGLPLLLFALAALCTTSLSPVGAGTAHAERLTSGGWTTDAVTSRTVAAGQVATITTVATASGSARALVDLAVYSPTGEKVFQRTWDSQRFRAGQTRSFAAQWAVSQGAAAGSYSVKVAIFASGWTKLLHWNDRAGLIQVTTAAPTTAAPPATTTPPTTTTTPPTTTTQPATTTTVASDFDRSQWLVTGERIPESSAWEPSGSFRTFCGYSHMSYDDPIVYPGQPGAAHLHTYFGNTNTNASSTYQSLRSSGSGTCQGGPLNRTGYWVPALHNAAGKVVIPDSFELYYKGNGSQSQIAAIQNYPDGLRMIAGHNMAANALVRGEWSCGGGKSTTMPACPAGSRLQVELRFPMCWNGQGVDSADHRSHMAYGTGGGGWFTQQGGCPATHPIHLPEITLFARYTADGDTANWYLSSDRMPGMAAMPNGSTFHADWFGAWDPAVQQTWTQKCVREMRSCVWGELGNGTRLTDHRGSYNGPNLIDPPPR